ncbi:Rieske (2Fe-2S) protein [Pedobacter sp. MW01-1-1]|uniref:Rieske (2Fe-2S) protein n=1 Tax=Pedobacter sp. MW01-1-1 TaxID=3383027 RepID=UPI003FF03E20
MKYLYSILCLVVLCTSCGKEEDFVPNVPVNYTTLLTDPNLVGLSSGKPVTVKGQGVAGLILYRNVAGKYVAYDRCSTVNPRNMCAVEIDDNYITVTDPCTGAKFLLEDGSPAKAPAARYLREYLVSISGNTIRVTN